MDQLPRSQPPDAWRATGWLKGQPAVTEAIAAALLSDGENSVADELAFLRGLPCTKAALYARLEEGRVLETLADCLSRSLTELQATRTATAEELHDKFVADSGNFKLQLGSLTQFFSGLSGLVGAPNPQVEQAMVREHCEMLDATIPFDLPNKKATTTSTIEWRFVADPAGGADGQGASFVPYPYTEVATDTYNPGAAKWKKLRKPLPFDHFEAELKRRNEELEKDDHAPVGKQEFWAVRLYTGPMYLKHNAVLRGLQFDFMRSAMVSLCCPKATADGYAAGTISFSEAKNSLNTYTTTLHAINSAIIKLGKLTQAKKVYRGVWGGVLPEVCRTPNEYGVRGGIEGGFMSTTTDKATAFFYARGGADGSKRDKTKGGTAPAVVFETQMGMVDRGADVGWLSQFPQEAEILFAPLTGMEVRGSRVEDDVQVYEVTLTVNMASLTIEQVINKRQHLLKQLCADVAMEMRQVLRTFPSGLSGLSLVGAAPRFLSGSKWRGLTTADADARVSFAEGAMKSFLESHPAEWFNSDVNFNSAVQMALSIRCQLQPRQPTTERRQNADGTTSQPLDELGRALTAEFGQIEPPMLRVLTETQNKRTHCLEGHRLSLASTKSGEAFGCDCCGWIFVHTLDASQLEVPGSGATAEELYHRGEKVALFGTGDEPKRMICRDCHYDICMPCADGGHNDAERLPLLLDQGYDHFEILQNVDTKFRLAQPTKLADYTVTAKELALLDPNLSLQEKHAALDDGKTIYLGQRRSRTSLPSLGGPSLQQLQRVSLYACEQLVRLPDGLCSLRQLEVLDLTFCRSLVALPQEMEFLSSLQNLKLHGCFSLAELPTFIGQRELAISTVVDSSGIDHFYVPEHIKPWFLSAGFESWDSSAAGGPSSVWDFDCLVSDFLRHAPILVVLVPPGTSNAEYNVMRASLLHAAQSYHQSEQRGQQPALRFAIGHTQHRHELRRHVDVKDRALAAIQAQCLLMDETKPLMLIVHEASSVFHRFDGDDFDGRDVLEFAHAFRDVQLPAHHLHSRKTFHEVQGYIDYLHRADAMGMPLPDDGVIEPTLQALIVATLEDQNPVVFCAAVEFLSKLEARERAPYAAMIAKRREESSDADVRRVAMKFLHKLKTLTLEPRDQPEFESEEEEEEKQDESEEDVPGLSEDQQSLIRALRRMGRLNNP